MTDEQKVYRLLSQTLNPFTTDLNFNERQMMSTTTREFRPYKVPVSPDPNIPRSLQNLLFQGSPVIDRHQSEIDSIIEE